MTTAPPDEASFHFRRRARIAGRHPPQTVPAPHFPATSLKELAPSSIADSTVRSVMALHKQTYNSGSLPLQRSGAMTNALFVLLDTMLDRSLGSRRTLFTLCSVGKTRTRAGSSLGRSGVWLRRGSTLLRERPHRSDGFEPHRRADLDLRARSASPTAPLVRGSRSRADTSMGDRDGR
jgi:hypothetical protein